MKFESDQAADILKTNLNDPGFHINFVSKLAEKEAEPWLPELCSILEERLKQVDEILKLAPNDPGDTESDGPKSLEWHLCQVLGGYTTVFVEVAAEEALQRGNRSLHGLAGRDSAASPGQRDKSPEACMSLPNQRA